MSKRGADLFVEALEQYGVTRLFGNPGTTELPVMDAVEDSDIDYVLAVHEDIAVGMASGYATTRRYHMHANREVNPLGVANLHVAPGLAHGIGNLIGAQYAGAPVLVTAGDHATDFRHEEPILSGDLEQMARQFTKWSTEIPDVDALPSMLRRAVRVALTPPTGPVFVGLPLDVMLDHTDATPERLGSIPNAGSGDPTELDRASDLLASNGRPVFVLGDAVARSGRDAVETTVELAEACGARVHGEYLMSEVNFPTGHAQWGGGMPRDATEFAKLLDAPVVAFIGCSTNVPTTGHDEPLVSPETKCIHISDDAWEVGKNYTSDAAVIGDPGLVIDELTERVEARVDEAERRKRVAQAEREAEERTASPPPTRTDEEFPTKEELADAMQAAASGAYLVNEGVTSTAALHARMSFDPEGYISNKSGGLGYGLPASVGAAIAESETADPRDVVGFIGDGSYLYYPHTIYTAARYDVDLTVVVPDNRNYRVLKENAARVLGGTPADHDHPDMNFVPPIDIPMNARSQGAETEYVDDPADIGPVLRAAIESEGPVVLDVRVVD